MGSPTFFHFHPKMVGPLIFHPEVFSYKVKLFKKSLHKYFQQTCSHGHTMPGHSLPLLIYYTMLLFKNMNFTIQYCIIILSVITNCCCAEGGVHFIIEESLVCCFTFHSAVNQIKTHFSKGRTFTVMESSHRKHAILFHAVSKDYTCTKCQHKMTPAHGHLSTVFNINKCLVCSRKQLRMLSKSKPSI
jgi:hypothetical protein